MGNDLREQSTLEILGWAAPIWSWGRVAVSLLHPVARIHCQLSRWTIRTQMEVCIQHFHFAEAEEAMEL